MAVYYSDHQLTLHHGDALTVARELPASVADCIVTSPPYFGLRDYGAEGQYGLESSPSLYVARMRRLFSELHRVLADNGTLWLNLGDTYSSGHRRTYGATGKHAGRIAAATRRAGDRADKNLLGMPWRVAFALQDDGWTLRNAIIWRDPKLDQGVNPGDVWDLPTQPFPGAHFAVMPPALAQRCILAGCKPDGTVLDPFSGSGTTGLAAQRTGRRYVGIDINSEYLELSLRTRLREQPIDFGEGA